MPIDYTASFTDVSISISTTIFVVETGEARTVPSCMPDCVGGGSIAKGIPDFLRPSAVKLEHLGQLAHPFPYLTFRGKGEAEADVVGGSLPRLRREI